MENNIEVITHPTTDGNVSSRDIKTVDGILVAFGLALVTVEIITDYVGCSGVVAGPQIKCNHIMYNHIIQRAIVESLGVYDLETYTEKSYDIIPFNATNPRVAIPNFADFEPTPLPARANGNTTRMQTPEEAAIAAENRKKANTLKSFYDGQQFRLDADGEATLMLQLSGAVKTLGFVFIDKETNTIVCDNIVDSYVMGLPQYVALSSGTGMDLWKTNKAMMGHHIPKVPIYSIIFDPDLPLPDDTLIRNVARNKRVSLRKAERDGKTVNSDVMAELTKFSHSESTMTSRANSCKVKEMCITVKIKHQYIEAASNYKMLMYFTRANKTMVSGGVMSIRFV
jgi:hypothetical protein